MKIKIATSLLLIGLLEFSGISGAQVIDPRDGQVIQNAVPCIGSTQNGMRVPVYQTKGPSPAWAWTSWVNGMPMTVYSEGYFSLPAFMQTFSSLHECGHTQGIVSEFDANCYALSNWNWSPLDIAKIRQFHYNLGSLPPQYGGSGTAFWQKTIQLCSEFGSP